MYIYVYLYICILGWSEDILIFKATKGGRSVNCYRYKHFVDPTTVSSSELPNPASHRNPAGYSFLLPPRLLHFPMVFAPFSSGFCYIFLHCHCIFSIFLLHRHGLFLAFAPVSSFFQGILHGLFLAFAPVSSFQGILYDFLSSL